MEIHVARQPIFNRKKEVYGYELLFRHDLGQVFQALNGDLATSKVLTNSFSLIGINSLTTGKRAFINFTRNLLLQEVATTFPPELLAVELLEDVEVDQQTIDACKHLKQLGFLIVLDDFVRRQATAPLVPFADIIKVDFRATTIAERRRLIGLYRNRQTRLLAEKVETGEEVQMALDFGYTYMQGYFYARPETLSAQEIPSHKVNYLRLLAEINQPTVDFETLEAIILREVGISYKLLRFINSAYFGLRHQIQSVRHALTMLGTREIRKWASLVALSGMGLDKPHELTVLCALRGKFCELLGEETAFKSERNLLYLMGLFSLMDAFTDQPLGKVLGSLPLNPSVKQALQREGGPYAPLYETMLAYEVGNWTMVSSGARKLQISEFAVSAAYQAALLWTNQIFYGERHATPSQN